MGSIGPWSATTHPLGFSAIVKEALRTRVDFLVEQGFVQRDGDRLKLPKDLLTTLCHH
jgi:hypothetical protein